ncbi:MAG: alkaline phosphatase family protein, partial [Phycisphaerae bacterium]
PDPAKNRQAPDLVVTAKDGYAFDNYATGEDVVIDAIPNRHKLGHHGYPAADPRMNAVFIAAGRGVKSGQRLGVLDNVDVAPTIAKLLGLKLPGADGKVITGLLSDQK